MNSRARAVRYRRDKSPQHRAAAAQALLGISGFLFSFVGAALALNGLLSSEGSAFSVLAGSGLILAGPLVARGHRAGAWAFLAVFAATVIWSLRNVEHGGTPLAMRLVGPSVLLVMIALLMPSLRGWRRRKTAVVLSAVLVGTIAVGVSSASGTMVGDFTAAANHFLETPVNKG